MSSEPQLHSSIISMVSLAAAIAAKHPSMGQCQLRRLREMGVPAHQIDAVIEIARHIRDEAGQVLDEALDEVSRREQTTVLASESGSGGCCSGGAAGPSCC